MVIKHCPTEKMLGDHLTKPLQGALFSKFRVEIMKIPDDLDMGDMGMYRKGLKRISRVNYTTRLIIDAHRSVLVIVAKLEGKMVLWSAQISEYVEVRTMPLNW